MDLQGDIQRNLSAVKGVILTGSAGITRNCRVAQVTSNGHLVVMATLACQGLEFNGSKNPADWENVIWLVEPWTDLTDTVDFVLRTYKPHPQAVALNTALEGKGGAEGVEAFQVGIIEWLHANPAANIQEWKAAYISEALIRGWFANDTTIREFVANYFNKTEWVDFVSLVLSFSPDTWVGKSTVIDREVA